MKTYKLSTEGQECLDEYATPHEIKQYLRVGYFEGNVSSHFVDVRLPDEVVDQIQDRWIGRVTSLVHGDVEEVQPIIITIDEGLFEL